MVCVWLGVVGGCGCGWVDLESRLRVSVKVLLGERVDLRSTSSLKYGIQTRPLAVPRIIQTESIAAQRCFAQPTVPQKVWLRCCRAPRSASGRGPGGAFQHRRDGARESTASCSAAPEIPPPAAPSARFSLITGRSRQSAPQRIIDNNSQCCYHEHDEHIAHSWHSAIVAIASASTDAAEPPRPCLFQHDSRPSLRPLPRAQAASRGRGPEPAHRPWLVWVQAELAESGQGVCAEAGHAGVYCCELRGRDASGANARG